MKVMIEIDLPEGQDIPDEHDIVRLTDPNWVSSWWHISDIHTQANILEGIDNDEAEEITDEEAREVLRLMDKYHDCDVGLNWYFIDSWNDHVKAQRKEVA